jgi:hypothetical protein
VKAYRWPHLPLNPFDLEFFDVPVYLAECSQPLTLEEFHNLKLFFRDSLKHRTVVLLREYPQFVSAVDTDLVDHWGSFAGSSDLLHLFLSESSPKVLHSLEKERVQTRVRSFLEQLSTTLARREFGRMDLSVFPRFLFNALRMLILEQEIRQGNWVFPITPVEVAEYLARRTPLGSAFPGKLLAEYERGAGRRGHFDERLLPKCRSLLTTMLEISRQRQSWEPLAIMNELPDESLLKISVAVVTADRPLLLERCLQSLTRLTRFPDELVVADNSHDVSVRQMVNQLQAPFPIQYFKLDQVGVARGRNAAARAAQGEIIAFVDDDATVEPEWLEGLERVFLRDPQVGLAAGSILNMACGRKDLVWNFMETVEKI